MLYFYVALFLGRSLVTVCNLENTWYLVKDLLFNQSIFSNWSEDAKLNKTVNLISFKKCNTCTTSSKFNVLLHFFHSYTYTSTKSIIEQLQSAWKNFFSVIIINALNKDQGLIQTKWLEKVQHIESVQRYTHGPSVTLTDGSLYISKLQLIIAQFHPVLFASRQKKRKKLTITS